MEKKNDVVDGDPFQEYESWFCKKILFFVTRQTTCRCKLNNFNFKVKWWNVESWFVSQEVLKEYDSFAYFYYVAKMC